QLLEKLFYWFEVVYIWYAFCLSKERHVERGSRRFRWADGERHLSDTEW
ncbi:unnamed protein product, partial [Acanthoscelides obtectus]